MIIMMTNGEEEEVMMMNMETTNFIVTKVEKLRKELEGKNVTEGKLEVTLMMRCFLCWSLAKKINDNVSKTHPGSGFSYHNCNFLNHHYNCPHTQGKKEQRDEVETDVDGPSLP